MQNHALMPPDEKPLSPTLLPLKREKVAAPCHNLTSGP